VKLFNNFFLWKRVRRIRGAVDVQAVPNAYSFAVYAITRQTILNNQNTHESSPSILIFHELNPTAGSVISRTPQCCNSSARYCIYRGICL